MDIRKVLEMAIDGATKEKEYTRIPLGKVSEQLRQEYKQMQLEHEELEDALEVRKEQLEREANRKIKAEFSDALAEMNERHNATWNKIYDELNVQDHEREKRHSINTATGEITKKVKVPKSIH